MNNKFIITTTNGVEYGEIVRYIDVVNVNIVIGTNIISDIIASFSDFFGGNSNTYQNKMNDMYYQAMNEMEAKARKIGANSMLHKLEEFGLIQYFSDVTVKNIKLFDDFIRKTTNNQSTVHGVHKRLKVYVKEAAMLKLIDENPYDSFVVQRGKPGNRKYLSVDEIEAIKNAEITDNSISNVRDCLF